MKNLSRLLSSCAILSLWASQNASASLIESFKEEKPLALKMGYQAPKNSFDDYKINGNHSKIEKSENSAYTWLDDEVLDIKNFTEATEKLISKDDEWLDSEKECPRMVRYLQEIKQDDLPIILKWLKLKNIEYFGIASTDKSADIDLIYPWYSQMEEYGIDLEKEGLYKLIYLNAKATLHEMRFNKGDFPEDWLENHRAYHSWNFQYQK